MIEVVKDHTTNKEILLELTMRDKSQLLTARVETEVSFDITTQILVSSPMEVGNFLRYDNGFTDFLKYDDGDDDFILYE